MLWIAPSWYRPPNAEDPQVAGLADDVEYRVVEEAHRLRAADEAWTVRLREQQANAWLSVRLAKWLEFDQGLQWPEALGVPQVRFRNEGVDLACELALSGSHRFVTVGFLPEIVGEHLALTVQNVALGRIELGAAGAERVIAMLGLEESEELRTSEAGAQLLNLLRGGATLTPIVELSDGRRLRLTGVAMNDGALDLTLVTAEE